MQVTPPDRKKEELIPWECNEARKRILQRLGESVSRQSMHRWVQKGYSFRRKGPYFIYPTIMMGNRRFTSREALDRFFTTIRNVKTELEQFDGDLTAWKKNQENQPGVRINRKKSSTQCVPKTLSSN